ncbi:hypothetical protein PCASD_21889, partial [Puccinia coronata f. sp. avenae]
GLHHLLPASTSSPGRSLAPRALHQLHLPPRPVARPQGPPPATPGRSLAPRASTSSPAGSLNPPRPPPPPLTPCAAPAGSQQPSPALAHPPVSNGPSTIQANQRRLRNNCQALTPPDSLQSEASKAL